jgi:hypothetical protein
MKLSCSRGEGWQARSQNPTFQFSLAAISDNPIVVRVFCSKLRAPNRGTSLGPFVCGANNRFGASPNGKRVILRQTSESQGATPTFQRDSAYYFLDSALVGPLGSPTRGGAEHLDFSFPVMITVWSLISCFCEMCGAPQSNRPWLASTRFVVRLLHPPLRRIRSA